MDDIPDFASSVSVLSGSGFPYEASGDSHQWKDQKGKITGLPRTLILTIFSISKWEKVSS